MSSQTHHRTNVIVDLNKIKKIQKISGENTIKGALNYAINKTIIDTERIKKMQKIMKLQGSGCWEGNLIEMRKSRV